MKAYAFLKHFNSNWEENNDFIEVDIDFVNDWIKKQQVDLKHLDFEIDQLV